MPMQLSALARYMPATRSRTRAAASRCHLLVLSHDELGVIFDGLADPLEPVIAASFSNTCKGLRAPLRAALEVLEQQHARAVALCCKVGWVLSPNPWVLSPTSALLYESVLRWESKGLNAEDMVTLGMILRMNGLPRLRRLYLHENNLGDAEVEALCDAMGRGTQGYELFLGLQSNAIGPAGAKALAAAFRRGAMRKLEGLDLATNPLGREGLAALAPELRRLPNLIELFVEDANLDDVAVSSLVADLGKDDYKQLETLNLGNDNQNISSVRSLITDAGEAKLAAAIDAGGLPKLEELRFPAKMGGSLALAAARRGITNFFAELA